MESKGRLVAGGRGGAPTRCSQREAEVQKLCARSDALH
jgi:hypothetical protein